MPLAETLRRHISHRVPAVGWLRQYDRRQLRPDLLAGCVVAALAIPQSLGYAAIAGVPVELGLYAVPFALTAYVVFGTSRQLVVGPVSTVSVMSGSLVAALRPDSVGQAVLFTTAAALWAGITLIVAAQLRIGWVAEFLSKPIVTGFVLGLTLLVILGELPSLLGITVPARDVLGRIRALVTNLDLVDPLTMLVGLAALVVLFAGARLAPRVPWSLIVLVGGLVASAVFDLPARVLVVGSVPAGLSGFGAPLVPVDRLIDVVFAGAALAFVGLAEGLSAARLFAVKGGYRVETDQELFAAGAANVASSLAGGLAVAGSLSKTAAVDRAGGKSQVASLAAAALSLVVILFFAPTLSGLPRAVLSAIVVNAVWGLIDIPAFRRYRASRRIDFVAACVAAVGVLVAGPLLGLLLAVAMSIIALLYRTSRVTVDVMGKVPGEKAAWGALENHAERVTVPGVLVLRLNEPLFWVNAAQVQDQVLALVDAYPDTQALLLDLECTDQLEITSCDMLSLLLDRLHERGIDLYMVRVRFRVRAVLGRTGVRERLGEDHLWHSISQGVRCARKDHGLKHGTPAAAPDVADTEEEAASPEAELIIARTVPIEPDDEAAVDDAESATTAQPSRRTVRRWPRSPHR